VISLTQTPVHNNTKQSQKTDIHVPVGFEHSIPAYERPHTHASNRAANGIREYAFDTMKKLARAWSIPLWAIYCQSL